MDECFILVDYFRPGGGGGGQRHPSPGFMRMMTSTRDSSELVSPPITNNIESVGERGGDQDHFVIKLVDSSKKNDPDLFELQLNKQKL